MQEVEKKLREELVRQGRLLRALKTIAEGYIPEGTQQDCPCCNYDGIMPDQMKHHPECTYVIATKALKEFHADKALTDCAHVNVKKKSDSRRCTDCKEYLGHWCENSPDKGCHYYTQEAFNGQHGITLMNGNTYILEDQQFHNVDYESEDHCLFCGDPEERK